MNKNLIRTLNVSLILLSVILLAPVTLAQYTEFHPELNWFTVKGKHVVVHYHEGAERTAKVVAKIGDEVWEPITSLYEYEPETVHYVIKDIDDYSNGATYFFDNKIEIWSSALDFELRGFHNWLRNVISHEFTHMVQIQASMKSKRTLPAFYLQWLNYEDERRPDILYGFPNIIASYPVGMINMPAWFAEGTAQYMRRELGYEKWDAHRDMILRSYALEDKMLTWNQMGVFEKTSLGNESVYNSGFALTRYIAQKYGEDKLRKITKALGTITNFTFDAACYDVLGITGKELYNEWSSFVKADYKKRMEKVLVNQVSGKQLFGEGFGNFNAKFFGGNDTIIFTSNKDEDYLSLSSIYLLDVKTGKEKLVTGGIRSTISKLPNTRKILYAKLSEDNPGWANVHDIFVYNIDSSKESRLTKGLRATQPCISPDGKLITYSFQKDGTGNLSIIGIDGENPKQLTFYTSGEQVFNPLFSPDGKFVYFDFAYEHGRDIVRVPVDGGKVEAVVDLKSDDRNPAFDRDGNLVFASDRTGIYNIYRMNNTTGKTEQITNVTGGAFMPSFDDNGNLVYSGYTASGYKLFYLEKGEQKSIGDTSSYIVTENPPLNQTIPNGDISRFDLPGLQNYNDKQIPSYKTDKYSGAFTKMTFFPVLRVDNYNTTSNFLEKLKPGVYISSTDMLDRYSIFGGATLNARMERDVFFAFDYRNRFPGLFELGIKPQFTLDLFSISRKSPVTVSIEEFPSTKTDVTYNLFEVGLAARHRVFARGNEVSVRYSFSKYTATIGSFVIPVLNALVSEFSDPYLLSNNLEVKFTTEVESPYLHSDINPKGFHAELKYNFEKNKFNPEGNYSYEDGILKSVYNNYDFHRFELNTSFGLAPFKNQTITARMRLGTILGPTVPDFFDFYLGGLIGMKAYPFYAVSGNEVAWLNLTYRFPLFRDIDAQFGHFYLDKIFMSVYGDYGSAW
ncbi:MAG: PD40 domain-containing protein, partial [Ignavibacteriales bacterium]|nr:PD40 domain-containing protein [Ignavibacteriales bacterium]